MGIGMLGGVMVSLLAQSASAEPIKLAEGEKWNLTLPASATLSFDSIQGFEVDRDANRIENSFLTSPRLRLGLRYQYTGNRVTLNGNIEHDVVTGTVGHDDSLPGELLPGSNSIETDFRRISIEGTLGREFFFGAGLMTSHWGMGILANDGARRWTPGSARFLDPRKGDRVIRGYVGKGLSESLGAAAIFSFDRVWEDDILRSDDEAYQAVAALILGQGKAHGGGAYVVGRHQTTDDGKDFDVLAIDATARTTLNTGESHELSLEAEVAYIFGNTTLAPNINFTDFDIRQWSAAFRGGWAFENFGFVLDAALASGDSNFDDEFQVAARFDPNYELGLLLFRQVLGAQTGRGVATASDPNLVGEPAEDIDRIATQGSVTNTLSFFPRIWIRPYKDIEIYGGPLVSFSASRNADAFNSRLGGGTPRNALDGVPSSYLGTELDLGVRAPLSVWQGVMTVGLEGGYFIPGGAFDNGAGESMDSVFGGRLILDVVI